MYFHARTRTGFTLIELLVVISIISLLSSVVLSSLSSARQRARDAQRLSDMRTIQTALEFYFDRHGEYPPSDVMGGLSTSTTGTFCGGWRIANRSSATSSFSSSTLGLGSNLADPSYTGCDGYKYIRYSEGSNSCTGRGRYYVLAVSKFESINGNHPNSPGFSCGTGNWQNPTSAAWVTGRFER